MAHRSEEDVKSSVMSFLTREFFFEFGPGGDTVDTNLFESERLDSLGFVKLVTFLEANFDVGFDISVLNPEAFQTVNVICETMRGQLVDSSAA